MLEAGAGVGPSPRFCCEPLVSWSDLQASLLVVEISEEIIVAGNRSTDGSQGEGVLAAMTTEIRGAGGPAFVMTPPGSARIDFLIMAVSREMVCRK